ncbi:kinesin motor domain-containing protein [Haematococcus lacustris]|uniref:Kinesin motor domain-containing protein n=1 Tax=Haematococcus lacustris TaxID=44745 RepID=A0A699YGJ0_HAELA|nr:kinesin motor domain-containing protein [Haematococcus lacustris]
MQVLVPERGASHSTPKEQLPGTARLGARSYSFDACLPGSTSQAELFEVCGIPELVAQALDGFAVTIFAFGQTDRCNYSVTASCVELYHEAVSDLMSADKAKQLQVRKDERGCFQHVPYRDSKLTQLLWDGLRGGGRALMLACLGPLRGHAEEALSTLHFAAMAQRIKSRPVILLDPQDALVMELRDTIRALREENRQLATAMAALTSGADTATILAALPDSLRLAAARNGMGSAPPGQPSPHQLQGADEAPDLQAPRLPRLFLNMRLAAASRPLQLTNRNRRPQPEG